MRVLDLYCGAGLVADGLIKAGCSVVGVDIEPQPRYPGPFIRADVLHMDSRFARTFDAVWASPPCLRDTAMKHAPGAKGDAHPDLIGPTRKLLQYWDLPYVIENVETAPLIDPVTLCGSMFDLGTWGADGQWFQLRRHRKIETNWPLHQPACRHTSPVVGIYGGHARNRSAKAGGRGTRDVWPGGHTGAMRHAMGLTERGLTCEEISQGIPPAYACYVADRLKAWLSEQRRAA